MRIFICFMPVMALCMLASNYSHKHLWGSSAVMEPDPRAEAPFKRHMKLKGTPKRTAPSPQMRLCDTVFAEE